MMVPILKLVCDADPREIAYMTRLRGANTMLVGVQPEEAMTMVQLGLHLEGVATGWI